MEILMTGVELGIHQQSSRPVVEDWDWNQEIEPKLRAVALRGTFVSTEKLALRDPQLDPIVTPIADGYAIFRGPGAKILTSKFCL
jgi:hypothetical protein